MKKSGKLGIATIALVILILFSGAVSGQTGGGGGPVLNVTDPGGGGCGCIDNGICDIDECLDCPDCVLGGGGSGPIEEGVPECPAYYTCSDGSQVPWCTVESGVCTCGMSPQMGCTSPPVMIPSIEIVQPRNNDVVAGVVRVETAGTGSNEDMMMGLGFSFGSGGTMFEMVEDCTISAGGPVGGGVIYTKSCYYDWDTSSYSGAVEITASVQDANGGSGTSIVVYTGAHIESLLTVVVRDQYTSQPIENAEVTLGDLTNVQPCVEEAGICEVTPVIGYGYTDSDGKITFTGITAGGLYEVSIQATNYLTKITRFGIDTDAPPNIDIVKVFYLEPLGGGGGGGINVTLPQPEPVPVPIEPPPFPKEVVSINLNTGWNLISLPGEGVGFSTTCSMEKPLAFVYLKDQKRYATIQEASEILGPELKEYLAENAFWIYSYESCELNYEVEEYTSFNDLDLSRGWNLVPITVDMEGISLEDIEGSCEFESSYIWDSQEQAWTSLSSTRDISSRYLYKGLLLKASNSCTLGGARLTPPKFPE